MCRGNTSKNVIWAAGVATCQCRCGWQRSIISGDSYRVKRLQIICIKQHKKVCEMAKVDDVQPGVGWYTWDWNDTAKAMGIDDPTEGVIAQELKAVDPSAVIMGDDGYYSVDYSKVSRSREAI